MLKKDLFMVEACKFEFCKITVCHVKKRVEYCTLKVIELELKNMHAIQLSIYFMSFSFPFSHTLYLVNVYILYIY